MPFLSGLNSHYLPQQRTLPVGSASKPPGLNTSPSTEKPGTWLRFKAAIAEYGWSTARPFSDALKERNRLWISFAETIHQSERAADNFKAMRERAVKAVGNDDSSVRSLAMHRRLHRLAEKVGSGDYAGHAEQLSSIIDVEECTAKNVREHNFFGALDDSRLKQRLEYEISRRASAMIKNWPDLHAKTIVPLLLDRYSPSADLVNVVNEEIGCAQWRSRYESAEAAKQATCQQYLTRAIDQLSRGSAYLEAGALQRLTISKPSRFSASESLRRAMLHVGLSEMLHQVCFHDGRQRNDAVVKAGLQCRGTINQEPVENLSLRDLQTYFYGCFPVESNPSIEMFGDTQALVQAAIALPPVDSTASNGSDSRIDVGD